MTFNEQNVLRGQPSNPGQFRDKPQSAPDDGVEIAPTADEEYAARFLPDVDPAIGARIVARTREVFDDEDEGMFFSPAGGQQPGYVDVIAFGYDKHEIARAQKFTRGDDGDTLTDYPVSPPHGARSDEPYSYDIPELNEAERQLLNEEIARHFDQEVLVMVPSVGMDPDDVKDIFVLDGDENGMKFTIYEGTIQAHGVN